MESEIYTNTTKIVDNNNNNNNNNKIVDTKSINTKTVSSSKIVFNLKWKTGSFECNLLNAHSKLIEENGQFKLEVNLE
jgi:hypothetical protein